MNSRQSDHLYLDETEPLSGLHGLGRWVFFLLLGASFGRSFFHLGIPAANVFIGEAFLFLFVVLQPRVFCDRWIRYLVSPGALGFFSWSLLISLLYGVLELIYGVHSGFTVLDALKIFIFDIYPFYFLLGVWAGMEHPSLLKKAMRAAGWVLAIYGPLYFLALSKFAIAIPGTDVPVFPQPGGGELVILSLLSLERKPSRFWFLIMMAAINMLVVQVRAEWLAGIIALTIWGLFERRLGTLLAVGCLLIAIVTVGFVGDIDLPSPAQRGGRISSREIAARGLSVISPEVAQDFTTPASLRFYQGTMYWRLRWWSAIWNSQNDEVANPLLGHGYGFPLGSLVRNSAYSAIRTPHSVFFFALAYSGWIGVTTFLFLQLSILLLSWRAYRLTGCAWGIACLPSVLAAALFGNVLESPMGAIPYYLLLGLFIGPTIENRRSKEARQFRYVPPRITLPLGPTHAPSCIELHKHAMPVRSSQ